MHRVITEENNENETDLPGIKANQQLMRRMVSFSDYIINRGRFLNTLTDKILKSL